LEEASGLCFGVEIEFIDEEDIRPGELNDFGDVADLGIVAAFEVGEEAAGLVAVEGGVEGGDADGSGLGRGYDGCLRGRAGECGGQQAEGKDEEGGAVSHSEVPGIPDTDGVVESSQGEGAGGSVRQEHHRTR
jgi:hypothetical protein